MAEFRTERVEAPSKVARTPDSAYLQDRTTPPESRSQKTADETKLMEKDGRLPKFEVKDTQTPSAAPPPSAEQTLKDKYGVETVKKGDKVQYKLPNVSAETIAESGATTDGTKRIEKVLEQRRDEKVKDLESKYNVSFSKDGERVSAGEKTISARAPRLDELAAIEAGLSKSQPATMGDKVRIVMATENVQGAAGLYYAGKEPMIVLEPNAGTLKHGMLESDAKINNKDIVGATLESVTMHELGHHSQWKAKWDDKPTQDALARKMGWDPIQLPDGTSSHMLRTKEGKFYRCDDTAPEEKKWFSCNKNGTPMDAEGKSTTEKGAARMSNERMLEVATVKPVAPYPNPTEMLGDGLKYYRMNSEQRAKLLKADAGFYTQIEEIDQAEINKAYGAGKYMRNPGGDLVPVTDTVKREVFLFEVRASNKK